MIIGISSKFDFGRWNHNVYAFDNESAAEKWLNTEEYDFRERELFGEERMKDAVKLAGIEPVMTAIYGREPTMPELWKELRKVYGLTQAELSAITEIPMRSIQNWESGSRTAPNYMLGLVECKLSDME